MKLALTITKLPLDRSLSAMMSGLMATTWSSKACDRSSACVVRWRSVSSIAIVSVAGPSVVSVWVLMTLTVTWRPSRVSSTWLSEGSGVLPSASGEAMRARVAAWSGAGTWLSTRSMPTSAATVS